MIVASQPKITFYTQEILTLDSASESSMKQHIVDTMLTIGKPGKIEAPIGMMYIAKNRNGECKIVNTCFDNQTMRWG